EELDDEFPPQGLVLHFVHAAHPAPPELSEYAIRRSGNALPNSDLQMLCHSHLPVNPSYPARNPLPNRQLGPSVRRLPARPSLRLQFFRAEAAGSSQLLHEPDDLTLRTSRNPASRQDRAQ